MDAAVGPDDGTTPLGMAARVSTVLSLTSSDMNVLVRKWIDPDKAYHGRQSICHPDMGTKKTLYGTAFPTKVTPSGRAPVVQFNAEEADVLRTRMLHETRTRDLQLPHAMRVTYRNGYQLAKTQLGLDEDAESRDGSPRARRGRRPLSPSQSRSSRGGGGGGGGGVGGGFGGNDQRSRHPGHSRQQSGNNSNSRNNNSNSRSSGAAGGARPQSARSGGSRGSRGGGSPAGKAPAPPVMSEEERVKVLRHKFIVRKGTREPAVDQDAGIAFFEAAMADEADPQLRLAGRLLRRWRAKVTGVIGTKYMVNKVAEIARVVRGHPDHKLAAAVLALWLRLQYRRVKEEYEETHDDVFGHVKGWLDKTWSATGSMGGGGGDAAGFGLGATSTMTLGEPVPVGGGDTVSSRNSDRLLWGGGPASPAHAHGGSRSVTFSAESTPSPTGRRPQSAAPRSPGTSPHGVAAAALGHLIPTSGVRSPATQMHGSSAAPVTPGAIGSAGGSAAASTTGGRPRGRTLPLTFTPLRDTVAPGSPGASAASTTASKAAGGASGRTRHKRPSTAPPIRSWMRKSSAGPPPLVDGPRMHRPRWMALVERTLMTPTVDTMIDRYLSTHYKAVVAHIVTDAPPM